MFKYRDHRELLCDSMETAREFETKKDLVEYLQMSVDKYGAGKYNCQNITIEPYGFDNRIGWNTHIVHLEGYGVFGFTDGRPSI